MKFEITPCPPGYVSQIACLSPEVLKAQAEAERKNHAKWQAEKLAKIKDWSDPIKRAVMQDQFKMELDFARDEARRIEEQNIQAFEIPEYRKLESMVKVTELKPVEIKVKSGGIIKTITSWFK